MGSPGPAEVWEVWYSNAVYAASDIGICSLNTCHLRPSVQGGTVCRSGRLSVFVRLLLAMHLQSDGALSTMWRGATLDGESVPESRCTCSRTCLMEAACSGQTDPSRRLDPAQQPLNLMECFCLSGTSSCCRLDSSYTERSVAGSNPIS
jgi:hypothetical protein